MAASLIIRDRIAGETVRVTDLCVGSVSPVWSWVDLSEVFCLSVALHFGTNLISQNDEKIVPSPKAIHTDADIITYVIMSIIITMLRIE